MLTITGKNFVAGKGKNQVFFYTTKGGGTFTKAGDASNTRLKVVVPAKLAALLPANGDKARILLRDQGQEARQPQRRARVPADRHHARPTSAATRRPRHRRRRGPTALHPQLQRPGSATSTRTS